MRILPFLAAGRVVLRIDAEIGLATGWDAAASLPVELSFLLRHDVSPEILREAARIARRTAISPDLALIRSGLLDEERYYRALAAETKLPFRDDRAAAHAMARYPEAILSGLVPLAGDSAVPDFAYAPRGDEIARCLAAGDLRSRGLSIATPGWIRERVMTARARPIAAMAADGLARKSPHCSFRGGASPIQVVFAMAVAAMAAAGAMQAPLATTFAVSLLIGLAFLGNTALRLAAVLETVPTEPTRPEPRASDAVLPVYTILVPLFREARILPRLLQALSALDYPAAKLDVKLVIEACDIETIAALQEQRLPGFIEVVVAPPGEPRTKPRALNVALPLARGALTAVYDAEDVPDPGQLRLAVSTFGRSAPDVACLQARLVIDNAADGLLTRGIR